MDRDISLDAIKLVACIFVCTLHTIGMFMSESLRGVKRNAINGVAQENRNGFDK